MLLEKFAGQLPSLLCVEWPRARSKGGYGQICVARKVLYVHRLAFIEDNGREPRGEVRHTCDNPPCFNPAHLIEGTHRQNAHDMLRRLRQPRRKLDWGLAGEIRRLYATGGVSQRQLARDFGVSQRLVCGVVNGKSWPLEAVA